MRWSMVDWVHKKAAWAYVSACTSCHVGIDVGEETGVALVWLPSGATWLPRYAEVAVAHGTTILLV